MRLTLVAALLGSAACVNIAPGVKFRSVEVRPMDDERVVDDFENHRAKPVFGEVVVVENDEAAGLDVVDGTLKQFRGQDVEMVGTFTIEGEYHSPFYPSDYLSTARKVFCWPQVPLTWVTLGIWLIIPTSYFCWGKTPDDRDHWIAWVKQIVDSAGGNLGVVTFGPKKNSFDEAKGYVMRVKAPAPASVQPAAPSSATP